MRIGNKGYGKFSQEVGKMEIDSTCKLHSIHTISLAVVWYMRMLHAHKTVVWYSCVATKLHTHKTQLGLTIAMLCFAKPQQLWVWCGCRLVSLDLIGDFCQIFDECLDLRVEQTCSKLCHIWS